MGDLPLQAPAPELPEPAPAVAQTPKGTAYYLLYNGILGDKHPASGNVLTSEVLAVLVQAIAARKVNFTRENNYLLVEQ